MAQMFPLVSVVMPTYNAEAYILSAVESVLNQTVTNIELIIIDDHSTDGTRELLQSAARKDPRVQVLQNEENIGAAQSRNRAFQAVRGQYVALLDSDDLWRPEKLERQLALARETDADIIYCSYEMIDEAGEKHWPDFIVPEQTNLKEMLSTSVISCSTALLKAELCRSYSFPKDVYHEDFAYWLLLLQQGFQARGVTEVLASYRVRENSRSSNKLRSACGRWSVYRNYLGLSMGQSLLAIEKYAVAGLRKYKKVQ